MESLMENLVQVLPLEKGVTDGGPRRNLRPLSVWAIVTIIGLFTCYLALGTLIKGDSGDRWNNFLWGLSNPGYLELYAVNGKELVMDCKAWQGLTFGALHGGLVHLVPNLACMVSLVIMMRPYFHLIELFILSLLSAFSSVVIICYFYRMDVLVGASAVCCGLLGGYIALVISNLEDELERKTIVITVIVGNITIQALLCFQTVVSARLSAVSILVGLCLGLVSLNCPFIRKWKRPSLESDIPHSVLPSTSRPKYTPFKLKTYLLGLFVFLACLAFLGWIASQHCIEDHLSRGVTEEAP